MTTACFPKIQENSIACVRYYRRGCSLPKDVKAVAFWSVPGLENHGLAFDTSHGDYFVELVRIGFYAEQGNSAE
jgi:hypothetical protein